MRRMLAAMAMAVLVGCSGSSPTAPSGGTTGGGTTGGTTGGGSTGGGTGGGTTGGAVPATAAVVVGNIFFRSGHNGTTNAAVDTVAAGGTVTWTWTGTGSTPHSIESEGAPGFTSSTVQTGGGSAYQMTFATPGTYHYDCAVHGSAMSGTIVVR